MRKLLTTLLAAAFIAGLVPTTAVAEPIFRGEAFFVFGNVWFEDCFDEAVNGHGYYLLRETSSTTQRVTRGFEAVGATSGEPYRLTWTSSARVVYYDQEAGDLRFHETVHWVLAKPGGNKAIAFGHTSVDSMHDPIVRIDVTSLRCIERPA
jgi:hypothetical protein